VGKLRTFHHDRARLLALGHTYAQVGRAVNMTAAGVKAWAEVPANQELIAQYRQDIDEAMAFYTDYKIQLLQEIGLIAAAKLKEQLLEAEEDVPLANLVKIMDTAMDRTGLAKTTVVANLNIDMAAQLERARAARLKVVEGGKAKIVQFRRRT